MLNENQIYLKPVDTCRQMSSETHAPSFRVYQRSIFVLVNDSQWMWWERNMAWLQVCLLFSQCKWMRLAAVRNNNNPVWDTQQSSHKSFALSADGSVLLQCGLFFYITTTYNKIYSGKCCRWVQLYKAKFIQEANALPSVSSRLCLCNIFADSQRSNCRAMG